MNKKITFLINIAIIAVIMVVAVLLSRKTSENPLIPRPTPRPSPSASSTGSPQASSRLNGPTPTPASYIIPKCWLGGEIIFEGGVFKTSNAYFNYDQITDNHDFIRWAITPSGEDVSIGPNMFAGLEIPSGRETITINFNSGKPKYAEYILKASVDYPVELPEGGKVLNAVCPGETKLIIK